MGRHYIAWTSFQGRCNGVVPSSLGRAIRLAKKKALRVTCCLSYRFLLSTIVRGRITPCPRNFATLAWACVSGAERPNAHLTIRTVVGVVVPITPLSLPQATSEREEELIQRINYLSDTVNWRFDETVDVVKGGIHEMRAGFAEVREGLDMITRSVQESLLRLKNLQAPNYPYPCLVVVEEVGTRGKKSLLNMLRGKATREMTLHFLCPVDMSKVPCGQGGEGYRFRETRGWVKRISPVLQV